MKKSFFSFLWEKKQEPEPIKSTPVVITSYSQPHVLQQRMAEEKLTHGQTVKANLSPVRIQKEFGKTIMYFCPLQDISITEQITAGDGGGLPAEATLIDFAVPSGLEPGLYTIENATLFSNGTMQVIANKDTVFKPFSHATHDLARSYAGRQFQADRNEYLRRITTTLASDLYKF